MHAFVLLHELAAVEVLCIFSRNSCTNSRQMKMD